MGLSDLEQAMDILESGQAGKIVLVPWGEPQPKNQVIEQSAEVTIGNR